MHIITTVNEMREFIIKAKQEGKSIALVPTMGYLHEGHLSLMRVAKQSCDLVVVSIFVNPIQFGPNEDFSDYPRDLTGDSQKAASVGVDVIFHPTVSEMYPTGYATFVNVEEITDKLCGLSRPGHFRGVTTVVNKLFNIVKADKAFFGQKDAQQVLVIKRMVSDLNMNTNVEIVPIVRELDGLAMSSRNKYLSEKERKAALVLSRSLKLVKQSVLDGLRDTEKICELAIAEIQAEPLAEIDYVKILDYPGLKPLNNLKQKALLALAVRIGRTRLIDNEILEV